MADDYRHKMKNIGMDTVSHIGGTSLLEHSLRVSDLLTQFGATKPLVEAGLFHSVYGREKTQFKVLDFEDRQRIRDLIGQEAEQICYINCIMTFKSYGSLFWSTDQNYSLVSRLDQVSFKIAKSVAIDLLNLNFCNALDHAQVMGAEYKWFDLSFYIQNSSYLLKPAQDTLKKLVVRDHDH